VSHNVKVIAGGAALLAVCYLVGRMGHATPRLAFGVFILLWLVAIAVNTWFGITKAGYSLAEELPIALLDLAVLGVPAFLLARYLKHL
jgi:hypothetical protein